jgi:integrase
MRASRYSLADHGLVFLSGFGTPFDVFHGRRAFRRICVAAEIGENWSPRELRHTFVSIMSEQGVPVEKIARLVGPSRPPESLSTDMSCGRQQHRSRGGR